jgi:outer membrane translocation and assembly module TamA
VAGVEASFRYRPDRSYFAEGLGVVVAVEGQFHPAVLDAVEAFGGVHGEVNATWVPRLGGRLVVATRLGGSVLGGRVPFARAARIGGPRTLRGFAVDRFAGDRGSAYGSLELRSRLTRFRLGIAPGDLGILVFGSGGRVWQGGEESGVVHWAGGGGLWIAPSINWLPGLDDIVGRVELAHSDEGTFFYFGTGFRF